MTLCQFDVANLATGNGAHTLANIVQMGMGEFAEKPSGRFMIRSRTRVVKWHPEGDC
jgi:hypothetical protein